MKTNCKLLKRCVFRTIGIIMILSASAQGLDISSFAYLISRQMSETGFVVSCQSSGVISMGIMLAEFLLGTVLVFWKTDLSQTKKYVAIPLIVVWEVTFCITSAFDQPAKDIAIGRVLSSQSAEYIQGHDKALRKDVIAIAVRNCRNTSSAQVMLISEKVKRMKADDKQRVVVLTASPKEDVASCVKTGVSVFRMGEKELNRICNADVGIVIIKDSVVQAVWKQNIFLPNLLPYDIKSIYRQSSATLFVIKLLLWFFYLVTLLCIGYTVYDADAEKRIDRVGDNKQQYVVMKKEISLTKRFWLVVAYSMALFLMLCWTQALQDSTGLWIYSIGYFAFTWLCLDKYHSSNESVVAIIMAIVLGRIVLEVPVRLIDYVGTLWSLSYTTMSIIAVILGYVCHKYRNMWAFVMSIVIAMLFIIFVAPAWKEYCFEHFC